MGEPDNGMSPSSDEEETKERSTGSDMAATWADPRATGHPTGHDQAQENIADESPS